MPIKAMIAEDEHLAREELAYLIRQEEDVELCPSAEDGQQLLQLYRRYRPDVIFLDIEMPKRSGIDAARKIREDSRDSTERLPCLSSPPPTMNTPSRPSTSRPSTTC